MKPVGGAAGMKQRTSWWLEARSAPVVATVAMLVGGMAYSLFWMTAVHGGPIKLLAGGDLFSLAKSSSALLHGHFSAIYYKDSALTSPPALELVLAPVVGLGQVLGLAGHLNGGRQALSLWLVIGPAGILIGSVALFAVDAIARSWGFSDQRRLALALVGGIAVGNVVVVWGHPEDCVSLALVLWSALLIDRHRADRTGGGEADGTGVGEGYGEGYERALGRCGWLLGLAIAFQPLAILGLAPMLARFPWRTWARLSYRIVLPSVVLLAAPLMAAASHTLFVQIHQPFQPGYISDTPLTHLAPTLGHGLRGGGPTRLIAIALGAALGFIVCRRRHDLATVLSVTAVAYFFRVLFESELNWYYFWPVVALSLLLAMRQDWPRFTLCALAALGSMALGNRRVHHIDLWWPAIMATTIVMLLAAVPWGTFRGLRSVGAVSTSAGRAVECETMDTSLEVGLGRE
jgi:hypothetical protein